LMLLLADRQIYERFSVNKALEGGPGLHAELARALGRSGAPEGRLVLERLLVEDDLDVRREAVFALGELEQSLSRTVLLETASGADREIGTLAVEALAKIEVPLADVLAAMADLPERERRARLLPALYRFDKRESLTLASGWLGETTGDERAWAAYALARRGIEEAAPWLRQLLTDPDPWVRGWAARTLGAVGDADDMARIEPLLEDVEEGPIVQALRAGKALVERGELAPPPGWRDDLLRLMSDARPGVRHTALEVAEAWLLDEEISAVLVARSQAGSRREQQIALLALAGAGDLRAGDLTRRAAASSDVQLRRRAAQAAGLVADAALLDSLAGDPHPAVRVAVFEARLTLDDGSAAFWAEQGLEDLSSAVRSSALRWLTENPELPLGSLRKALAASSGGDRIDLELGLIRAVRALVEIDGADLEQAAEIFDAMAESPEFLVRREASAALREAGIAAPPVGPADELRPLAAYRETLQRTRADRWVDLATSRGTIRLRLACPRAPLTCLSFLQLAEQGFYDGLLFHRVVPDFVVQAGDPSGGGWGGPGYTLRDEINRIRYKAGVLGMAHAGPDTAGSQFFITLSAQPHLDGGYTAFGWVEDGWDVLRAIEQEDEIVSIREVEP
jgi:cyclophilin family peptidyl-prolyl cis-trans isomerase/HEAT repeat protein